MSIATRRAGWPNSWRPRSRALETAACSVTPILRGVNRKDAGFSDLVHGSAQVAGVTHAGDIAGLTVIGAGTASEPDVLAGAGVAAAVSQLQAEYDHVILTAASLPRNGDALALAPAVDATILVVTSGKSRRPRAIEARDALERVGARILGVRDGGVETPTVLVVQCGMDICVRTTHPSRT